MPGSKELPTRSQRQPQDCLLLHVEVQSYRIPGGPPAASAKSSFFMFLHMALLDRN